MISVKTLIIFYVITMEIKRAIKEIKDEIFSFYDINLSDTFIKDYIEEFINLNEFVFDTLERDHIINQFSETVIDMSWPMNGDSDDYKQKFYARMEDYKKMKFTGSRKKVISKGHTLEVSSYVNDGDDYKTNSLTFESKEKAIAVHQLCKNVFISRYKGGIGNSDEDERFDELIIGYMRENPNLYLDNSNPSDEDLINICMRFNYDLLGSSEGYYSRVFESAKLYYSKEDVYLDEIELN